MKRMMRRMDGDLQNIIALFAVFAIGFLFGRRGRPADEIEPLDVERLSATALSRIADAITRGEKLEAVRIAREDCGCGLAEAKKFVDARAAARRKGDPISR